MNCENCGIPEGAYSHPGYWLRLKFRPQTYDVRQVPRTVWVCGSDCAVQTMFIATVPKTVGPGKDGIVKWQMSLKEFTSQMQATGKLAFLEGQTGGQTSSKTPINIECQEPLREGLATTPHETALRGDKPSRVGGRPRSENPSKSALKKRRQRQLFT